MKKRVIYFHKDFDGVAAAAMFMHAMRFIDNSRKAAFELRPIDYDEREAFIQNALPEHSVVLDYVYHSDAEIWFDHHATTFSKEQLEKKKYTKDEYHYWNENAKSTPSILIEQLKEYFPLAYKMIYTRFRDFVKWSDKIDSAIYEFPEEYYDLKNKYVCLSKLLENNKSFDFITDSVWAIYTGRLSQFIKRDDNVLSIKNIEEKLLKIESVYKKSIQIYDKIIVVRDLDEQIFDRYFTYWKWPDADYRIATIKRQDCIKVSVNFNPWAKRNNHINIGFICQRFQGGGRNDVGSFEVQTKNEAESAITEIVKIIKSELIENENLI